MLILSSIGIYQRTHVCKPQSRISLDRGYTNTIFHKSSGEPLSGDGEVDETYHGGKPRAKALRERTGHIDKTKRAVVLGMVERGGKVHITLSSTGGATIKRTIGEHVLPASMIFTDEADHAVSHKWLQGYINEYAWRYNRRHDKRAGS